VRIFPVALTVRILRFCISPFVHCLSINYISPLSLQGKCTHSNTTTTSRLPFFSLDPIHLLFLGRCTKTF
jgi:hypothetical protein